MHNYLNFWASLINNRKYSQFRFSASPPHIKIPTVSYQTRAIYEPVIVLQNSNPSFVTHSLTQRKKAHSVKLEQKKENMEIGSGSGSSSKVIPESVMEAVKRTSSNIDEVEANLEEFLSYCNVETLSRMEPLERAKALFLIAKATTTLFACM